MVHFSLGKTHEKQKQKERKKPLNILPTFVCSLLLLFLNTYVTERVTIKEDRKGIIKHKQSMLYFFIYCVTKTLILLAKYTVIINDTYLISYPQQLIVNPSIVHFFCIVIFLQGGSVLPPQYLKFPTWYKVEICTTNTPCELMTIDDVID